MSTGIRIALSWSRTKIKRPLTDEGFTARHKHFFDILGNEPTPAAKHDFKFKDYAPWVVRELRVDYFHLGPSDYFVSLTAKYLLTELPPQSRFFLLFLKRLSIRHQNDPPFRTQFPPIHLEEVKLPHGKKPDIPQLRRKLTQLKSLSPEVIAIGRAMRESDPKCHGTSPTDTLPEVDPHDRQQLIFYQDEGGLRATDEVNDLTDTIYHLGIIDILTPYGSLKKIEHFWQGLKDDRNISDRFFFVRAIMRGGGGGERFKEEK
ncbi:hypothetical protein JAAARDRAFT_198538 [Jaapia argillacea MUCL 33604]|uniref:PIPK domain-containing protein n=1 Tax=Jaapia argillacea MUCL 33604 TaxID=933084 RepID=A0A067PM18_9AGAM|nr:hypothetical protein JAAARDRAFT_198538 [Jaapia argillacea MUCL 33604]